jgi:hypothetical protein
MVGIVNEIDGTVGGMREIEGIALVLDSRWSAN